MKRKIVFLLFLTITMNLIGGKVLAQSGSEWKLIGPGDADQVSQISIMKDGTIFLGTDIGGFRKSVDRGESWTPANKGLINYDICTPIIEDRSDSKILHVGTRGGFVKSLDGGNSWVSKRKGLRGIATSSLSGSIGGVEVDPFNPGVLYLGYGYGSNVNQTTAQKSIRWASSLYKSYDRGESWVEVGNFGKPVKVNQIVHSQVIKNLIYVAADQGLYVSKDGGNQWQLLFEKNTVRVLLFPGNENLILASCGPEGVYMSIDGGRSWAQSSAGLGFKNHPVLPDKYSTLALDPANERTVYVLNTTWGGYGGAYKSTDGGRNWRKITSNLPKSWLEISNRMNAIAIDPKNTNTLYLGSSRYIYRSDDGGNSWIQLISKRVNQGWTHRGINVFGHTRVVAVNPGNSKQIFIGTTDHGMVKSEDDGVSWNLSVAGMKYVDAVWGVGFCKTNPRLVYAISLNNQQQASVSISQDGGNIWNPASYDFSVSSPLSKILVSPSDCKTVLVSGAGGILKTTDGGKAWEHVTRKHSIQAMALDSMKQNTMYYANGGDLHKSIDLGSNWQMLSRLNATIKSILISKKSPKVIFLGVDTSAAGQGGIYKSTNEGITWTRVLTASRSVVGIVQLASTPDVLYAATGDDNFHDESTGSGVFQSIDHGDSWTSVNYGLAVLRAWNINIDILDRVFVSANGSGAYILTNPAKP